MPSSAICTASEAKQQSIFRTIFLTQLNIQRVTINSKYSKHEIVHLIVGERKVTQDKHKRLSSELYTQTNHFSLSDVKED